MTAGGFVCKHSVCKHSSPPGRTPSRVVFNSLTLVSNHLQPPLSQHRSPHATHPPLTNLRKGDRLSLATLRTVAPTPSELRAGHAKFTCAHVSATRQMLTSLSQMQLGCVARVHSLAHMHAFRAQHAADRRRPHDECAEVPRLADAVVMASEASTVRSPCGIGAWGGERGS